MAINIEADQIAGLSFHRVTGLFADPVVQIGASQRGPAFATRNLTIETIGRDGKPAKITIPLFADTPASLRIIGDPIPMPAEIPAPSLQAAE